MSALIQRPLHTPLAYNVTDSDHWHAMRAQTIGGSEVASLFGEGRKSYYTLWHEKAGKVSRPQFNSERMELGNLFEAPIAQYAAKKQGWKIQKRHQYLVHPTVRGMGASLDYEILGLPEKGVGCLEIKNVDYLIFRDNWIHHEDGSFEAPLSIELQLQHQMAVKGSRWGAIAAMIGGNDLKIIERDRDEAVIQKLYKGITAFWDSIENNIVPPIGEAADLQVLKKIFTAEELLDLDGDVDFYAMLENDKAVAENIKALKEKRDLGQAHILDYLFKNYGTDTSAEEWKETTAICNGAKFSYKKGHRKAHEVKESFPKTIRITLPKNKG